MQTLFERLGGAAAVERVVDDFYQRVLADEHLKPMFAEVELQRLKAHQRRFLAYAFGQSAAYAGRGLGQAHAHLVREHGLNDSHFDQVIGHLSATLADLGVSTDLIDEVLAIVESVREQLLGRAAVIA